MHYKFVDLIITSLKIIKIMISNSLIAYKLMY